jgi:hypothetical protein
MDSEFSRCLLTIQPSTFSAETRNLYVKTNRDFLDGIASLISEGIQDESIRPCRPRVVVLAMLNSIGSMVRWYKPSGDLDKNKTILEIVDLIIIGIAK